MNMSKNQGNQNQTAGATGASSGDLSSEKPKNEKDRAIKKAKVELKATDAEEALGATVHLVGGQPVELKVADVRRLRLSKGKQYQGKTIQGIVASKECYRVAQGRSVMSARGTLKPGELVTLQDFVRSGSITEDTKKLAARRVESGVLELVKVGENLFVNYDDRILSKAKKR